MKKNEIQSSADLFLYKSHIDLNSAKCLLEAYNKEEVEIDIEKIYFELQQCAEKFFKSLLCAKQIMVPKTHDLEQLIALCEENGITFSETIDTLIELSDYAAEGRYAIIHDDLNEADKYIHILKELLHAR